MLRWRKFFSTVLQGDDDTNTAFRDVVPNPIDDDGVEVSPPSHEEVKVAIMHVMNNKAAGSDGIPADMFKAGCNELVELMHQLIYKIWPEGSPSNDFKLSVLCPVLKKGGPYDMRQLQEYKPSHYRIEGSYRPIV